MPQVKNPLFLEDSLFKTIIPIPMFNIETVTDPVNQTTGPVNQTTGPVNQTTDPVKSAQLALINKIQSYLEVFLRRQDYKQKLLSLIYAIASQEGLKSQNYALEINSSVKSTKRYLQELKELGIIEFTGAPKTGGYYLSTQFNENR